MKIEEFKLEHVQEVLLLHAEVSDGWGLKGLINDTQNTNTKSYILKKDNKIVAFCAFVVVDDAELVFLCVDKNYKRQGIAEFLLTESIKMINPPLVVLEVRSENQPAINLYKKLGFTYLGLRKNFYSFPEDDALVFELRLKEKNV